MNLSHWDLSTADLDLEWIAASHDLGVGQSFPRKTFKLKLSGKNVVTCWAGAKFKPRKVIQMYMISKISQEKLTFQSAQNVEIGPSNIFP